MRDYTFLSSNDRAPMDWLLLFFQINSSAIGYVKDLVGYSNKIYHTGTSSSKIKFQTHNQQSGIFTDIFIYNTGS